VVAEGRGLRVDERASRPDGRAAARGEFAGSGEAAVEAVYQKVSERSGATKFLGYEATEAKSEIVALVAGGEEVTQVTADRGPVGVDHARDAVLRRAGRPDRRHRRVRGPRGRCRSPTRAGRCPRSTCTSASWPRAS
jgi:hypothetical protein